MMTRRTRITIVLLVLISLILLLIWFFRLLFATQPEVVIEQVDVPYAEEKVEAEPVRSIISDQVLDEEREIRNESADVVSASKTFVARYGSYSNEANFANLIDVLPLMSKQFAKETQEFIDTAQAPDEYYGVTTSVITVNVDEKDENKGIATVTITTQREEAIGALQNIFVRYQDIVLIFVKEEGEWKVDSATWQ